MCLLGWRSRDADGGGLAGASVRAEAAAERDAAGAGEIDGLAGPVSCSDGHRLTQRDV